MSLMSPAELERHLVTLAKRLTKAGIQAEFYLVGGAAMSIGYMPDRRLTTDIDAKIQGFAEIQPHVAAIASQEGLPLDWLNDAAAKLVSFMAADSDWRLWKVEGSVAIYFASPELLLAMKAAASRPKKDAADLECLLKLLEIRTIAEVEYIFEKYFPGDLLPKKAVALIGVLLQDVQ